MPELTNQQDQPLAPTVPVSRRARPHRRKRLLIGSILLLLVVSSVGTVLFVTRFRNPSATTSVSFSPDGQLLAAASTDQLIRVWSVSNGSLLHTFANPGDAWPDAVAFSPDGQLLAAVANRNVGRPDALGYYRQAGTVRLWEVKSGKLLQALQPQTQTFSLAFSPTDHTLAVGIEADGSDIELWDVPSGQLLRSIGPPEGEAHSLAFSPDGRTLAVAFPFRVGLIDIASGRLLQELSDGDSYTQAISIQAMALRSDGRMLALATWHDNSPDPSSFTGEGYEQITLWDVASGKLLRTLARQGGAYTSAAIWSLAFSPDGHVLASGSADHQITLWEVTRGMLLRTLSGHSSEVLSLAFRPDGSLLASGSKDLSCQDLSPKGGSVT